MNTPCSDQGCARSRACRHCHGIAIKTARREADVHSGHIPGRRGPAEGVDRAVGLRAIHVPPAGSSSSRPLQSVTRWHSQAQRPGWWLIRTLSVDQSCGEYCRVGSVVVWEKQATCSRKWPFLRKELPFTQLTSNYK